MNEKSFNNGGILIIRDTKTKELIRKKHNMVVNSGKDFIFKVITSSFKKDAFAESSSSNYDKEKVNSEENYFFYQIGTDESQTTSGMKNITSSFEKEKIFPEINDNGYYKFSIHYESSNISNFSWISELGIYFGTAAETSTLYSRIVFDPIPVNSESKFDLTYFIYFK